MLRCCRWYLLVGLGLGIAATGLIFLLAWRNIFDILVTEEKSLLPGTAFYKEWRRPAVHPTWQLYVFNWTNADAVLSHPQQQSSAQFQQLGPFTYDEHSEIVDAKFHSINGTLTYRKRTFFKPYSRNEQSIPTKTLEITSVNFLALIVSHLARDKDYAVQRELSYLLHSFNQGVTITKPIGQLLFTGFREPILEEIRKVVCREKDTGMPCQDDRLAYFRTFNVSRRASDIYSLDIGAQDRSLYGRVLIGGLGMQRFGKNEHTACDDSERVLTGELFPSRLDLNEPINVVLPELCRRLTLTFNREVLVDNIPGYLYTVSFVKQENSEECPIKTTRSGRYGILNNHECYQLPMYESEAEIAGAGSGNDYFVIEPTTGTVLESHIGLTYHTHLKPNPHIALFQDVPEFRVPLFRFTRTYRLNESKALKLKQLLHLMQLGYQVALAGCVLGAAIVVLTVLYAGWNGHRGRHARKLNADYSIVGTQLSSIGRDGHLLK
ncbi:protein croquemort-like [Anopheles nili]|uniref:protein croquemort-like n=1 Tax=Anopheles nili TaxID=185578 RepID=UPI00237A4865|nr:protein croquemort-like [Anopheles nili]